MLLPLIQGISFAMAPLLSIGPFKVFVLSEAVTQGWRRALPLATVPLIADIPVIVLLWVVLQRIPEWSLEVLRTIGGAFYIYLAFRLIRGAQATLTPEVIDAAAKKSYWQAVLAVWVSPAVYINWSVIGVPALIGYAEQSALHAVMFLFGFYAVWVGGLAVQIVLAGQAGRLLDRRSVYLIYAGSALLIGFGIYQIWFGLRALIGT